MYAKASETRTATATSARQTQGAAKTVSTLLPKGEERESALSMLIQNSRVRPKLVIGKPNDRFEQEADQTAEKVVQNRPLMQFQPEEQEEEEGIRAMRGIMGQAEEEEVDIVDRCLVRTHEVKSGYGGTLSGLGPRRRETNRDAGLCGKEAQEFLAGVPRAAEDSGGHRSMSCVIR